LKPVDHRLVIGHLRVSPGLTAGRGLKHQLGRDDHQQLGVSPGLTAGRGLKRQRSTPIARQQPSRPA